jgi:anti-sigma factor (TIGR02949 family)
MRRAQLGGKTRIVSRGGTDPTPYITRVAQPRVTSAAAGVELVPTESGFIIRASLVPSTQRRRVTPHDVPVAQYRPSPSGAPDVPSGECAVVLASLWDYLDGNCSDQTAVRLIAHVPACTPCSRQMAIQEQFLASLAELRERSRAPAGLHKVVRRAVAAGLTGRRQA